MTCTDEVHAAAVGKLEETEAKLALARYALDRTVRMFSEIGGFLSPEHQMVLSDAKAALEILGLASPRPPTWIDRVCVCKPWPSTGKGLRFEPDCPVIEHANGARDVRVK